MIACPVCASQQNSTNMTCERCQADLSLLVHLNNQCLAYYNEGLRLAKSGAQEAALQHLQTALVLNPQDVDSYVVMGKLYAQQCDYPQAIAAWLRVLDLAPPDSPAHAKAEGGIAKAEKLRYQQQRQGATARRLHRALTALYGVAAFILGAALIFLFPLVWPPAPTPDLLSARWLQAVKAYPPLSQANLTARVEAGALVISGEVPNTLYRDLITAIGKTFPPHTLDASQVTVRPTPEAASVERTLAALPGMMRAAGIGKEALLRRALAGARVRVTATDDNHVRLSGTVPLPEIKQVVEAVAALMVGRERVDASTLQVVTEYLGHRVQPGDTPKSLARRYYGDSSRWQEIRRCTPENARFLRDPRRLPVGVILKIPKPVLEEENP